MVSKIPVNFEVEEETLRRANDLIFAVGGDECSLSAIKALKEDYRTLKQE